jgi:hypothetical protein
MLNILFLVENTPISKTNHGGVEKHRGVNKMGT